MPKEVACVQWMIGRAWLIDPIRAQVSSATTPGDPSEPWNGEFYSSFGHGRSRSWEDAVEYGFICAGGGSSDCGVRLVSTRAVFIKSGPGASCSRRPRSSLGRPPR
jgi:hypothetical protein